MPLTCNPPLPLLAECAGAGTIPFNPFLVSYLANYLISNQQSTLNSQFHLDHGGWLSPCKLGPPFGTGGTPTRIGDQVRFRASSVFLWPVQSSLTEPHDDAEIEGRVIGFSDSGAEQRVFAVIEVVKTQAFIVRVSELEVIESGG